MVYHNFLAASLTDWPVIQPLDGHFGGGLSRGIDTASSFCLWPSPQGGTRHSCSCIRRLTGRRRLCILVSVYSGRVDLVSSRFIQSIHSSNRLELKDIREKLLMKVLATGRRRVFWLVENSEPFTYCIDWLIKRQMTALSCRLGLKKCLQKGREPMSSRSEVHAAQTQFPFTCHGFDAPMKRKCMQHNSTQTVQTSTVTAAELVGCS